MINAEALGQEVAVVEAGEPILQVVPAVPLPAKLIGQEGFDFFFRIVDEPQGANLLDAPKHHPSHLGMEPEVRVGL